MPPTIRFASHHTRQSPASFAALEELTLEMAQRLTSGSDLPRSWGRVTKALPFRSVIKQVRGLPGECRSVNLQRVYDFLSSGIWTTRRPSIDDGIRHARRRVRQRRSRTLRP